MHKATLTVLLGITSSLSAAGEPTIASADFSMFGGGRRPAFSYGMKGASWNGVSGGNGGMEFRTGGSFFQAEFASDQPGGRGATLQLLHQTSFSAPCPENGWSPITVTLNGHQVVGGHSPGGNGRKTEEWEVGRNLRSGNNLIRIQQDAGVCSSYTLFSLSIRRGPPERRLIATRATARSTRISQTAPESRSAAPILLRPTRPSPERLTTIHDLETRPRPIAKDSPPLATGTPPTLARMTTDSLPLAKATPPAEKAAADDGATSPWRASPLALLAGFAAALGGMYWLGSQRSPARQDSAPSPTPRPTMTLKTLNAPASGETNDTVVASPPGGKRFRIVSRLGVGGMGEVFAAQDSELGRKVAIKRMRSDLAADSRARARFLQEARIIAHLTHPNIVRIFDVLDDGGEIYLVFEYIDGKSLSQLIAERGKIPLDETARMMRQVCEAVETAHESRVLHRDLKPSNIMMDSQSVAKVMDFGLARLAKDSISKLTNKDYSGTPAYMAPEQHLGDAHRASDVYSLGVCLYEMLTGSLPFMGPDFLTQKERMKFPPPQFLASELPPGIEPLIARLLEPDYRKRTISPLEASEVLVALLNR